MNDDLSMLDLRVRAARELAEGVVGLTLEEPSRHALPPWTPGSHIEVELGPGLARPYSLCGPRDAHDSWTVAVRLSERSRGGSARAHALRPGDAVRASGPRNGFSLEDARSYLFVAAGIGITPLVPMIEHVQAARAEWTLVYTGRSRATMPFAADLASAYGRRARISPTAETGRVSAAALAALAPADALVYACGPEPLLGDLELALDARGGATRLRVERFSPVAREATADQPFEIELASSGRIVAVPSGISALEALERAEVTVWSSCREGTCGTCEVGVLKGRPDHRDSILSPAGRETSSLMYVCVSRAMSPRITLDL